jgi:hypothetical protein
MRKKIFGGIAVLAIAAVAAWNVGMNSQKNSKLPCIMLANVDALAFGECGEMNSFWDWFEQGLTKDEYVRPGNCTVTVTITVGPYQSIETRTGRKLYCYDGGCINCSETECVAN